MIYLSETRDGKNSVVRYVPKNIPDSNIPQYFIRETSYPVLPTPEDFKAARISKSVSKTLANGEKIGFRTAEHTVPEYVEIKAVNEPVIIRAMWGMTRPTKLMVPEMDTHTPMSTDTAMRMISFTLRTFTPMCRALSSPMAKAFSSRP